ncbi:TPA_asm: plasmid mobilization protein [Salmonella enterica subsp. salamae serovar 48:d:z6]|uniref:Plasmid mobilization protein n=1 Tax=Salmonella enterica subsp. salamae serovar 48:d:z6 TaxID=1151170 RepID=A0A701V020_SALER|nr:plasmid mobilization protein [Salmonella enterica subsp. salamae serovar 48:d:z6]
MRRDRGGFPGGLLPFLPLNCRDRADPVRGGAGNRCYVKSRI